MHVGEKNPGGVIQHHHHEKQKNHHKKTSCMEELITLLEEFGIDYDEKYLLI